MVAKLDSTIRQVKADGRIDKKDVQTLVKAAADGAGITKAEATKLHGIREKHAGLFTKGARDGFDKFLGAMDRSWSKTKHVHLPNIDDSRIKELLTEAPGGGGRTSSGKGGAPARPAKPPVAPRPSPAPRPPVRQPSK